MERMREIRADLATLRGPAEAVEQRARQRARSMVDLVVEAAAVVRKVRAVQVALPATEIHPARARAAAMVSLV